MAFRVCHTNSKSADKKTTEMIKIRHDVKKRYSTTTKMQMQKHENGDPLLEAMVKVFTESKIKFKTFQNRTTYCPA